MQILYTAHSTATGGRDGRAVSSDKHLDVKLSTPKNSAALAATAPTRNKCLPPAMPPASCRR